VFSTKKRKIDVVNHTAPPVGESPSGGENSIQKNTAASGAPMNIHGRRRPQRERVRSETQPISGSLIASNAREIA
jgi:hypothetical protein